MDEHRIHRIISDVIDGKEYSGIVVETVPGVLFLASVVDAETISNAFREHTSQVFSDFETAKHFVLSEWSKLRK
ncbi:hypothetical protein [Tumebacillus permanentifrigoris]|uniref:Uncharacterized protein n=1 Tax=Tumebacillus permanentifrigoris TaxID=378543 RepID=A0A316DDY4_9BACL|nr:hypothetical protein [Tumebacillus permanentifrigoris]PWK15732.1 hypothetical protein C7459_103284 [Tumebacillus permanentifrigoris]